MIHSGKNYNNVMPFVVVSDVKGLSCVDVGCSPLCVAGVWLYTQGNSHQVLRRLSLCVIPKQTVGVSALSFTSTGVLSP